MSEALKPCPFCGHQQAWQERYIQTEDGSYWCVQCPDCDAAGPLDDTEAEAIAAWDRRVDGWIPVSERLPEDGESSPSWAYLCIHEKVGLPFLADYVPGLGWKTYRVVTHWQPIDPISRSDDA